jgi:hypothetical protein
MGASYQGNASHSAHSSGLCHGIADGNQVVQPHASINLKVVIIGHGLGKTTWRHLTRLLFGVQQSRQVTRLLFGASQQQSRHLTCLLYGMVGHCGSVWAQVAVGIQGHVYNITK